MGPSPATGVKGEFIRYSHELPSGAGVNDDEAVYCIKGFIHWIKKERFTEKKNWKGKENRPYFFYCR